MEDKFFNNNLSILKEIKESHYIRIFLVSFTKFEGGRDTRIHSTPGSNFEFLSKSCQTKNLLTRHK